jgi:primosomal protein N''
MPRSFFFGTMQAMPVPWLQIVQLVPSILDVSRELMKRTKQAPPAPQLSGSPSYDELAARVASLEDTERRQAELVAQMAEQLAGVARAVTDLHRRVLWLTAAAAVAVVLSAVALWIALI